MNPQSSVDDSLVLSYLGLRKAIGLIGMTLPFVLAFGKVAFESPGLQSSVSAYYYTVMRDVFVGSMCALAVFFMSYRGYEPQDALAGKLTCVFALAHAGPHLIEVVVPSAFSGLKLKALPHVLGALDKLPLPVAKFLKGKIAP